MTWFTSWLSAPRSSSPRSPKKASAGRLTGKRRKTCWPYVELLEDRCLLSAPRLVKDINLAPLSSNPANLTEVNGVVYFTAATPSTGTELWKTDGTPEGTVLVQDINPGSNSSSPANLTNVSGALFFTAMNPVTGTELWITDGTAQGTVLVHDINPGTGSSKPGKPDQPRREPLLHRVGPYQRDRAVAQ